MPKQFRYLDPSATKCYVPLKDLAVEGQQRLTFLVDMVPE
jgi:hypothetical protein